MLAKILTFVVPLQLYCVWTFSEARTEGLSKCQQMRRKSFRTPGSFSPACDKDGSFARRQCEYTVTYIRCWEADKNGKKTNAKETYVSLTLPPISTATRTVEPITKPLSRQTSVGKLRTGSDVEIIEERNNMRMKSPKVDRPPTKCERLRKRRKNKKSSSFIPACTKDGHFKREQCHVEGKKCWCVDHKGKRIPKTKVHNKKPKCYPEVCGKRFQKAPSRQRRVIGGREAIANTWPWQALVLFSDPKHICGATLVKRNWLVTAASCFDGYTRRISEWSARLGAHRLQPGEYTRDRISVEQIHIHPKYKQGNETHPGDYDVALIQVSSSAEISTNYWSLCLPDNLKFYRKGVRCSITGWGLTSNNGTRANTLREGWVDLVPLDDCNAKQSYNGKINDRFMCAGFKEGGVDACHFDTGGPLACPMKGGVWALAGIISWRRTCAQPHTYGVYTNVHVIKPWIEKTIGS